MEYIDFHVHAFADKIAERTIAALADTVQISPATDGTLPGTKEKMRQWGVDGFVLLTIATKPSQHEVCNNWAASCKSENVFPFGSVHPDGDDVFSELERIKALGLYGIKLHPDYQGFFADEERMIPIYRKCGELGLPVILHAGFDAASPDCIHCTPRMAKKALEAAPDTTFILAHLGGFDMWGDVERILAGNYHNLYMDTAMTGTHTDKEQLGRIIKKHGADRILLASDCPWDGTDITIQKIKRLGLSAEEERLIFSGNAEKLLNLNIN
ncbi:MAG: amidohydrolase [Oscillospiraceae bacterium]|nr:amidohydrolase [Oscillospiraceae bacterium]